MRIAFFGDLTPVCRSAQRFRALVEEGHDVIGCPLVPENPTQADKGSFFQRLRWKAGIPQDNTCANNRLQALTFDENLDLVWIEKGNTIRAGTLQNLKRHRPKLTLASFTEDDMSAFHNRSWFYTWGLKHYDFVFTTKSYNLDPDELPALGARRVIFIDKGYDPSFHRPVEVSEEDRVEVGGEVTFIGTFEVPRAQSLRFLAEQGVPIRVWGAGWESMKNRHPNLNIEGRPLVGDGYIRAICASRISLCFLRKRNRDLQTDRSLEIPACGGFMLAERTVDHQRLFKEDQEAVFFGDDRELLTKVQYYLEHEEDRVRIAAAGRERCLSSGYAHSDRMLTMLDFCLNTK